MSKNLIPQIGRKIRVIRTEQKLSIQEVADRASITKGMLSKIENGRSIPSLPVLLGLIKALNVDIPFFFNGIYLDSDRRYILTRANDTSTIEKETDTPGYNYQSAFGTTVSTETMEVVLLTIEPGAKREKVTTDAYEFKYIINGTVDYYLDDEVVSLEKGDFFFYDGRIPHVPINTGDDAVIMLVVYFFNSNNQ